MSPHAEGLLVRRDGRVLLGPVDHAFAARGITAVMGPNGAGKTTLLRALHGLQRLSEGRVRWPCPEAEARRRQAFVPQAPVMLRRSVAGNLAYPLRLRGLPRAEMQVSVQDWAARVGLGAAMDRPAARLSAGERQKLALARALILEPDLLLLDEPTASLDGATTRAIEALLLDAAGRGMRVILATHDRGQARRLADDVLFLLHGRVHEAGPASQTLGHPTRAETRAYLAGEIV